MAKGKERYTWRRPIRDTYEYMAARLGDPEKLSIRKQMCLAFMKWGHTCDRADRDTFVELAKAFRKEEGRQGGGRTIVETKARKQFGKSKKLRNLEASRQAARKNAIKQHQEGSGIHSEESKKRNSELAKKALKARMNNSRKGGKKFLWKCRNIETGEVIETRNLADFKREHGIPLDYRHRSHQLEFLPIKGWMIEKHNPDW